MLAQLGAKLAAVCSVAGKLCDIRSGIFAAMTAAGMALGGCMPTAVTLAGADPADPGARVEVAMIGEELEDSVELMKILQEQDVMPGQRHFVSERSEVMQSITLENENGRAVLPFHVARKITVIPGLKENSPRI